MIPDSVRISCAGTSYFDNLHPGVLFSTVKEVNRYAHRRLNQAETHLAQLIEEANAGAPVVIARAGKPLALLSAYAEAVTPGTNGLPLWQGTVKSDLSRRHIYDADDA